MASVPTIDKYNTQLLVVVCHLKIQDIREQDIALESLYLG
jgi:hypothetical protein